MEAEPPKATANNLALAAIPLGTAVVFGNIILLGLVYSGLLPPDFLRIAASAFVTAEGSFVAIWIAFGSRSLPIRLIFAIPAVAVVFLPKFHMWDVAAQFPFGIGLVFLRDSAITSGAIAFVFDVLLVVSVSVPLLTARVAGWRLIQIPTEADAINAQSAQNFNQFTLRQMFGWTLAVAMVAGLARLVARPDYFRSGVAADLLVGAVVCLTCGAVAFAAMWAALGRGDPPRRLLTVAADVGLVLSLGLLLLNAGVLFIFEIVSCSVLESLMTGCGLLLFRSIGLRLVRSRRTLSRSGNTPDGEETEATSGRHLGA
jgi:hypothetical protein